MTTGRRKSERSTRCKLSSPGRPPVWQREHLCRFWREIAAGLSSEEAAVAAGVSAPVGTRWFRSSGGMPPTHLAPSAPMPKHRSLSFVEREEIALECARGTGVRAIARKLGRSPSTISREIRRNSATRSGEFDYRATAAQWHADRAAKRPKMSKLASQPRLARLRSGSAVGPHCHTGRHRLRWPRRGMERTARCSPTKPALVICLESGADRAAPEGGLPQVLHIPR